MRKKQKKRINKNGEKKKVKSSEEKINGKQGRIHGTRCA